MSAGNVASISSKGSTVRGEFRRPVRYPITDGTVEPTTHFTTEVPTFADPTSLIALLEAKRVVVNAKPPNSGRPFVERLLVGMLPVLLLVGVLVFLIRGAAAVEWVA